MALVYTKSLYGLQLQPSDLIAYLNRINQSRINSRSWNFFKEGYVTNVEIAKSGQIWYCRAKVFHSQKTTLPPHAVKLEFDSQRNIKESFCNCVVGEVHIIFYFHFI